MGKHSFSAIFFGFLTITIILLAASIVLSLLLRFTSIQESSLTWVILALSIFAFFMGGLLSGGKRKQKGWLVGGGTGLLFSLFVFLIQFLGYQTGFSWKQVLYHLGYIVIAIIGGIIGVNSAEKRTSS